MGGRVLWMRVRLEEIAGHPLKEAIWIDVYRSHVWEVIARDLPVFGFGFTPEEAWEAFEKSYQTISGESFRSPQDAHEQINCPTKKLVRRLETSE